MKSKNLSAALTCRFALAALLLSLLTDAQAASKYKVLHYFVNKPASSPEAALVADSAGNLYGTGIFSSPDQCGSAGCGVVFKLTRESGGGWSYSIIHRFKGPDGQRPVGSMIFDSDGNLYGTTYLGGAYSGGTVFELTPSGKNWTERVLYSFADSPDLAGPLSALTFDKNGNLYGTANYGGSALQGGVFVLKHSRKAWKESVIHSFTGGPDGGQPYANLVWDSQGNLYSTAYVGGTNARGVIYELTPSQNGWTENVLYNFTGASDGVIPRAG
jgi:uncharacterized repeat protein (TIGR03803 family)